MLSLSIAFGLECQEVYGKGKTELKLATGSPGELGLLKVLVEEFSKTHSVKVCWNKAGSGKSLSLLEKGQIDIAMVHAPKAEKEAIKAGWATKRVLIGSNEFYIVGPKSDPAGIKSAKTAQEAYAKIAKTHSLFYTRADNSGTHKKELSIWKLVNITPSGSWYVQNKDFMLATLKKADKTNGYFMCDSSTYKLAKKDLKNLDILFRGDLVLVNTYVAMLGKNPKPQAEQFVDFLISKDGQDLIKNYGLKEYGESLYEGADYAKKFFES